MDECRVQSDHLTAIAPEVALPVVRAFLQEVPT